MDELKEILDEEEASFAKTLDRGEALFEKYLGNAKDKVLSGADVWRLYDTYGFPIDLTRLMAEEKGYRLDEEGVLSEEAKAKEKSRGARGKGGQDGDVVAFDVHAIGEIETKLKVERTNDSFKYGTRYYNCYRTRKCCRSCKGYISKGFC